MHVPHMKVGVYTDCNYLPLSNNLKQNAATNLKNKYSERFYIEIANVIARSFFVLLQN